MYRHLARMPKIQPLDFRRISYLASGGQVCLTETFFRCSTVRVHYFVSTRYLDIQLEARVRCMAIVLLHFEHILEVMKTGNSRFERSIYQNSVVLGRTTPKSTLNGFQKQTKHCKSQKHNRKGIGTAPNGPNELQIHHYEGFFRNAVDPKILTVAYNI